MTVFSHFSFNKSMLFAHRITKIYMPKKSFMKKVSSREGMKLAPQNKYHMPRESRLMPGFAKSCAFTAAFAGTAYVAASIWQYENRKFFPITNFSFLPKNKANYWKQFAFRRKFNVWWNSITEGQQVFWCIFLINVAVFCAWKYSPLNSFMLQFFCCSPASKAVCLPLLLSAFSHANLLHLSCNMMAFNSFCTSIGHEMGKEQMVGFYLTAAVFSGVISNGIKILTRRIGPSIGASGAIMAVIGYFCMNNPNARIGILFIPNYDFSASSIIKGLMGFDAIGILLGWKLFDHAGHLGGSAFGVLYAYFGYQYLWKYRHIVVKKWKQITD